jgi:hypothetical protein
VLNCFGVSRGIRHYQYQFNKANGQNMVSVMK